MSVKENNVPVLNGLVLTGGLSKRMGADKSLMAWYGKQHRYFLADMLGKFCAEVFISCRHDQIVTVDPAYKAIPDAFPEIGPVGGILSALGSGRDKAWLIVACDLPLLDEGTVDFLVRNRNPLKKATAFESPYDGLPEPTIAIWEPESYPMLLDFLRKGIASPRKALANFEKEIVIPLYPKALMNVNTVEDATMAKQLLRDGEAKDADKTADGKDDFPI